MLRRGIVLSVVLFVCTAAASRAQGVAIDHKAVGCIVVGKYPKMNACFSPTADLARSRVYFRPEGVASWYYVDMKTDQPCFTGTLPKPGKKLVGKKIEYYLEAQNKSFEPARTAEFAPIVVRSAQECKKNVPVAPFLNNATVAVFPSVPAGFVGGGIGTAAVVGIVGVGAAAATTAAVVASNNNDSATTTTVPVVVNPTTTTTLPTTTTTTTTTLPPASNRAPFAVLTTNPDPPSGQGPLTVTFDLCKSTDPENQPLNFFFDFGDGAKASGSCIESHTYQANFRSAAVRALDRSYTAEACVVDSGNLSACRTRTVNALSPPPACGPTTVVISPPTPPDCSGNLNVSATTTNASSVQFCVETGENSTCPPANSTTQCAAGTPSGNTFTANFTVAAFFCSRVTADATGCGGTASATPVLTQNPGCGFMGQDASTGKRLAGLSSDLTVERGRLQVVVNGASPFFAGRGRFLAARNVADGENRVEAVLVESAGKAGLWRIEISPVEEILAGSLRVITGEAVLVGASSATFRLSGREGERIVFTFLKK
jgi:hypothetical protein